MDELKKAEIALDRELHRQIGMTYGAISIALNEYWGWGKERIQNMMERTSRYWDKCADTNERSMLQMVEEETGIEIRSADSDKSWHELCFLNANYKQPKKITRPFLIRMRQEQLPWVGPQVVACFVYTLHRREGWGKDRIVRLLEQTDSIKDRYADADGKWNEPRVREACWNITGVRLIDET